MKVRDRMARGVREVWRRFGALAALGFLHQAWAAVKTAGPWAATAVAELAPATVTPPTVTRVATASTAAPITATTVTAATVTAATVTAATVTAALCVREIVVW